MKKRPGKLEVAALLLFACTACSQAKRDPDAESEVTISTPVKNEPYFCGGETAQSNVHRFFAIWMKR